MLEIEIKKKIYYICRMSRFLSLHLYFTVLNFLKLLGNNSKKACFIYIFIYLNILSSNGCVLYSSLLHTRIIQIAIQQWKLRQAIASFELCCFLAQSLKLYFYMCLYLLHIYARSQYLQWRIRDIFRLWNLIVLLYFT